MSATTAQPAEAPAPAAPEADPFLEVFERLSNLGEDATAQQEAEAAVPTPAPAPEPAPEPAPAPEPEPEPPLASVEFVDTPEQRQPPASTSESDEDLLRRLGSLINRAPQAPEPAPAPAPAPEQPPMYSADEQAVLAEYQKEWPDVARAEALLRRAEYAALLQHVFTEVARYVQPVMTQVDTLATGTQLGVLEANIPDYDATREKVVAWAAVQPAYLKAAYEKVIEEGTADEVLDLVDRWRAETGAVSPPNKATPPAPASAPTPTPLPPATRQAAAALAPVNSKRSGPTAVIDPQDFGAAFASFAASEQ